MNDKLRELIKKKIMGCKMDLDQSIEYIWELAQKDTKQNLTVLPRPLKRTKAKVVSKK